MKVAIALCLVAFVAVAQAGFSTNNLVERAQPALQQAMFKVRLMSRSANTQLQTEFVQGLHDHANQILGQIQNGISLGQDAINALVVEFHNIQEQLTEMGHHLTHQASQIISGLLGTISNLWGSIFGKIANRGIGDWMGNWINSTFPDLIDTIQGWIHSMGMSQMLQNLMAMHLPDFVSDWIIENIINANVSQKGWFNFENIFGIIGGGISSLWTDIANLAQEIFHGAQEQFGLIQELAQRFLDTMMLEGMTIANDAAQDMLGMLQPYAADLGQLYTDIEAQVNGLLNQISGN